MKKSLLQAKRNFEIHRKSFYSEDTLEKAALRKKTNHSHRVKTWKSPSEKGPFWMASKKLEEIRKQLADLLQAEATRRNSKPRGSIVLFLTKKMDLQIVC